VYDTITAQKGRVDIVVANAGILEKAKIGYITEEHFDRIFSINVKGLVFSVQKALPLLSDGGAVILMSSTVASKGLGQNSRGNESGHPQLRSWMDCGPQGPKDPGQCDQPRADRHTGPGKWGSRQSDG
jgi:NAD(P)-dependent dehydrogenase (short-subunit alcohol dehydrogenase family)